jgi:hypothetical protein
MIGSVSDGISYYLKRFEEVCSGILVLWRWRLGCMDYM